MNNTIEVVNYYLDRVDCMKDYEIICFSEVGDWGIRAVFMYGGNGNTYQSVYVFKSHRGKGRMKEYVKTEKGLATPFITVNECRIEDWFIKNDVNYLKVDLCFD